MTDDVRIATSLRRHRKTKRLKRHLGTAGCWSLVCLFLWAGEERWTGDLAGLSDADIEEEADWEGEPGAFVRALIDVRFLVGEEGERAIHEWAEHNPYAASKGARIEKGKKAAGARWSRREDRDATSTKNHAQSMQPAYQPHATRTNEQCPPAPTPAPTYQKQEQKHSARQAARFEDWWSAYPKKVGKKTAQAKWASRNLDAVADRLIADVKNRAANDDGWQRGFIPDPTTYLNQDRWDDELRVAPAARAAAPAAPSKTFALLQRLEDMKHGLAGNRTSNGSAEVALLGTGTDPRD